MDRPSVVAHLQPPEHRPEGAEEPILHERRAGSVFCCWRAHAPGGAVRLEELHRVGVGDPPVLVLCVDER